MPRTIIILDDPPASLTLKQAMLQGIATAEGKSWDAVATSVGIVTVGELGKVWDVETIYCPLTLNLPAEFEFWGRSISRACLDIDTLRHLVATRMGVKVGDGGSMWLPAIWTARGPMYGEVIGTIEPGSYQQPIHLDDRDRQPLYQFAYQLLNHLSAPPATYLIQFSYVEDQIVFDRLLPFPALPAVASIGIQSPDLFACHWKCITEQPMLDVLVKSADWE
jgi:hypothetical protein